MVKFNEWEKETPQAVRRLIVEAANWPTAFSPSPVTDIQELLAARMQNLYLLGVNDGIRQGADAAIAALKQVGGAK